METQKPEKTTKNLLKITGYALAGIQLLITIAFIVLLHMAHLIPNKYQLIIDAVLLLVLALVVVTQRFKVAGIITKVISVVMSVVLVFGNVYLYQTYSAIKGITGNDTMITQVGVYTLSGNEVKELSQFENMAIGRIKGRDSEAIEKMAEILKGKINGEITYKDYADITELADALLNGEIDAMVVNVNYVGMLSDVEGYGDFGEKTAMIYSQDIETKIEEETDWVPESEVTQESTSDGAQGETAAPAPQPQTPPQPKLNGGDTITIYFSGIDQYGPPSVISRSDVNVIAVINKTTHQILMVSTPRDYYVTHPNSQGIRDKLTHAGNFGVNCSIGALENIYNINIDYYVKVNFTGFVQIIDALGGIEVYSDHEFTTNHGGYHYVKGVNKLNGIEALGFARDRYNVAGGDRQRGRDHMKIIEGVIKKLASPAILNNYSSVLTSLTSSAVTNMPYDKITELIRFQIDKMPSWDIVQTSADGVGEYRTTYSMNRLLYVMIPDVNTINNAKNMLSTIYSDKVIAH